MRFNLKDIILGSLKSAILLILLEIITSSFFPSIGLTSFRPPFSVLIVLYVAFKINNIAVPFVIMLFQGIHSVFSIEGWAIGTLIGLIVALMIKYFKDLLDFSTSLSTVIVVQISQLVWFILLASLISIKLSDFSNFFNLFFEFVPESILLSLLAPFFFNLLDRLWFTKAVRMRA